MTENNRLSQATHAVDIAKQELGEKVSSLLDELLTSASLDNAIKVIENLAVTGLQEAMLLTLPKERVRQLKITLDRLQTVVGSIQLVVDKPTTNQVPSKKTSQAEQTALNQPNQNKYIQAMLSGKQTPEVRAIIRGMPPLAYHTEMVDYVVDRLRPNLKEQRIREILDACVIPLWDTRDTELRPPIDTFAATLATSVLKQYKDRAFRSSRIAPRSAPADDEFKYDVFRSNERRKASYMKNESPYRLSTKDYVDALDVPSIRPFEEEPRLNFGNGYLSTKEIPHLLKYRAIGYRARQINASKYTPYPIILKLKELQGQVIRHKSNGRRHSYFNVSEAPVKVCRVGQEYLLGVLIECNFYPMYLSENGAVVGLSRVPILDKAATLFNYTGYDLYK